MSEKLKLCPFCGKPPAYREYGMVSCRSCGIETPHISAWNRRAPLPAEQPSNPGATVGDFQRGVIAALAVLNSHGYPHGSVYHDSIVRTVGDSIYAVADDEDYEWAGLDLSKKPKNRARIVGQQTKGGGNA